MRHRVNVGDAQAVEDHANELGRAPAGELAFHRIFVPAPAAVDHETLHLKRDIGVHVAADGAGTANWDAVLHQRCCLQAFLRGYQVQTAKLVIATLAPPVAERFHPAKHCCLIGDLPGSCLYHVSAS